MKTQKNANILVIHNPVSGQKKLRNIQKILKRELKKKHITYTWFTTKPQKHQNFTNVIEKKYTKIIVIGGDGTIRDTACFLIKNNLHIPLGIIPTGTANILAKSLNIPWLPPVERAVKYALTKKAKPIDTMFINNKYHGLIAAGQGYDSIFIQGATRALKRKIGFFAYIYSFLTTYFSSTEYVYEITIDGKKHKSYGKIAMVFNLFSFPGFVIGKHKIIPDDGIANVLIFNPQSIFDIFYILIPFFNHKKPHPRTQYFHGKNIEIIQRNGEKIQVDGEIFEQKKLNITVKKHSLFIAH